ncbi:hypothetical protein CLOSTMETH_03900 [[Clostridium] methylpentosum DSM 5476]|uniref:Uncharacterized protein n=1 Tax=[Clostridium] methylpentosum DSM 5476 TaxID=537013 RepID=C0EJ54_9FIRM|nr:hypothetical protein CLOSTMETH_03900 [[Clostridium] methylpentosum DSM 5476]
MVTKRSLKGKTGRLAGINLRKRRSSWVLKRDFRNWVQQMWKGRKGKKSPFKKLLRGAS